MGNTWNYQIVLQEQQFITPELFERILSLASSIDYNLRFPVYVTGTGEPDFLQFFDIETFTTYMCSQGGCFTVWDKNDDDMLFTIRPSESEFSFGVQYNLREGRNEDNAHDLELFFSIVCNDLQPRFAYSHDEWGWEFAFRGDEFFTVWENFHQSIAKGDPPLVLCWLNYFEKDYFERIDKASLEAVEFYKLTETEHGMFVQLSEHPWNAVNMLLENGKYASFRYS